MKTRSLLTATALFAAACAGPDGSPFDQTSQAVTSPVCPSGPTTPGVDVSTYQHTVDWAQVKASGQKFGIARVSNGTKYPDDQFARNWVEIKKAGMPRGAYQYFEAAQDPIAQANMVIRAVGRLGINDMPVMLDMEADGTAGSSAATIVANMKTWIAAVKAGTGKTPYIYTGAYYWDESVHSSAFANYALDVAWYGVTCPGEPNAWSGHHWMMHQFTSSGHVPGIGPVVDMDVFDGDYAHFLAFINRENRVTPAPAVFRPSNATWYARSAAPVAFGHEGDIPVTGDYTGDHVTERGIWRPSTGEWAAAGTTTQNFGNATDVPVPADYDGLGHLQRAVWRPGNGTWYVVGKSPVQWGLPGDVPVPADYDGNGKASMAIWRPSDGTWRIQGKAAVQFGVPGDIPVPADYDGDGQVDFAVFRPSDGTWHIQGQATKTWGTSTDLPVPGDYNGDGVAQVAVFRPSDGTWHIAGLDTFSLGKAGDIPAAGVLDRIDLARVGLLPLPAPTLTCPASITAQQTSSSGAKVTYAAARTTSVLAPPKLSYSIVSGAQFPPGVTQVTVTSKDPYGTTSTCRFNVTVKDTAAPKVTCPSDLTVHATDVAGVAVTFPAAKATDSGAGNVSLHYDPAQGSVFPVGDSTVQVTATDKAGNAATCSFDVTVLGPGDNGTPPPSEDDGNGHGGGDTGAVDDAKVDAGCSSTGGAPVLWLLAVAGWALVRRRSDERLNRSAPSARARRAKRSPAPAA